MTHDERWLSQWKQIMVFIKDNKRRSTKFVDEELVEALTEVYECWGVEGVRVDRFKKLVEVKEKCRRVNRV